ncbi:phosphatidylserine/phosphatidylglycerophosphate/cardiolipin synthase family protein [Thioalkalivibrio sp. XN8]|uniref:phospholipase D-like domain-containing protein n=1 Tax=Thioalkalivibrio sp. XN8 TaxID=2712863 RepID=UPI0013EA4E63|nr:phosphatidylserine/phosphatidylglycerophosphate/cardiolipin synthase family protein [Thioalkalivibrio sp. XN8]
MANTPLRTRPAAACLLLLALTLPACTSSGPPEGAVADVQALVSLQPAGAFYRDGHLLIRYDFDEGEAGLVAAWSPPGSDEAGHHLRMAVMDIETPLPATPAELARDWEPVALFGYPRWRALVTALLEQFAPAAAGEATLVAIRRADFVVHRAPDGALRVHPLADGPAGLRIGRRVSEEAFSAAAADFLQAQLEAAGEPAALALFAVAEDELGSSFVLFDFARRQSVFIAPMPRADAPHEQLDFSLRVLGSVSVQGHVLTVAQQPFTFANRLFWTTAQSGLAALPMAPPPNGDIPPVSGAAPMDVVAWEKALDKLVGRDRYRGSMELLIDGEAFFETLLQAVQEAQRSIDIRVYIFDRDDYALRVADLLKARSQDIKVRVLVDRLGTLAAGHAPGELAHETRNGAAHSIVDYLRRDSNVEVRVVENPWFTSDHTKVIVIDRARAFVGGMNIGGEYRYDWHDLMVEVRGPIVGRLDKDFEKRWAHTGAGGDFAFALRALRPERHAGPAQDPAYMDLRPLYTRTGDPQVLRAQLAAMRAAQSRIYIQQPYVADSQVLAELIRARRRGVDVRMILPAEGDSKIMNSANLVAAHMLISNGVRVFVYPGMTHAKAALYDDWAIIGSANFDKLSLRINQETNLATSDPRFVEALERELFDVDFARSTEWTEAAPVGWGDYIARVIAKQL